MSLLTIISGACVRLSLGVPTTIVGSSNAISRQMLYLAQEEGKALSRRGAWKKLITEKTFTTTAAAAQTDALPSDVDWIVPDTFFNRTTNRRVGGPVSPEEWQLLQASLSTLVDPMFRIRGTSLLITPTPASGDTAAYEYITKNWCQSSDSVAQSSWADDDDTALLDEELHTLGLVWRFKRSKGLPFDAELMEYDFQVRQALMREGVRPRITTDPQVRSDHGGDVIAGSRPNAIVTEGGDFIGWD